jgi:hypothetical protein
MRCRYILTIEGVEHVVGEDCLKNWEDISFTLKRDSYAGVIRSFSSEFEFVGECYDLLLGEFLSKRYASSATITAYTITNIWEWEKQFECQLDFSTIDWDGHTLKINALDSGLASIIKAKKSTKYELVVGTDVPTARTLVYDRLKMQNTVTFEITGDSIDGSAAQNVPIAASNTNQLVGAYSINDEINVNSEVEFTDQSGEAGSKMISILKPLAKLNFSIEISVCTINNSSSTAVNYYIAKANGSNPETATIIGGVTGYKGGEQESHYKGLFATYDALIASCPSPAKADWAIIGTDEESGEVWQSPQGYEALQFYDTGVVGKSTYLTHTSTLTGSFSDLALNDIVYLYFVSSSTEKIMVTASKIVFTWSSIGNACNIDTIKPTSLIQTIVDKLVGDKLNVTVHLSDHDSRLASTYMLAAESVRGIKGAKIYSTFADFTSWMEAVFGYTYYIGDEAPSVWSGISEFGGTDYKSVTIYDTAYPGTDDIKSGEIIYNLVSHKFLVYHSGSSSWYSVWDGSDMYNDTTHSPRTDMLFHWNRYLYVDASGNLHQFTDNVTNITKNSQHIYFVHRSEIFTSSVVKTIGNASDFEYSENDSLLYSKIDAGYDKQDYDSINGRDEWNFTSKYSTDCTLTDNKLELVSKYRADCYGMEFDAIKRGEDTTDTDTDETVFFVLCAENSADKSTLVIDRTISITGALSDRVFNGAFSPAKCIAVNAGYIGSTMSLDTMPLEFTSTDGNSDVVIDGTKVGDDLTISEQLFTAGEIKFKTDDMAIPDNWNGLVELVWQSLTYKGYIIKAEARLGKQAGVEYTLTIKSIEQ